MAGVRGFIRAMPFRLPLVSFLAALFLVACGADTPVPDYPFPTQRPLEETEFAQYVGADDPAEGPDVEEEEWDDGLSDEDLEMPAGDAATPAPPAE